MKTTMIALTLLLGLAGGAALIPSAPAHAQGWTTTNGGGAQGGGAG